MSISLKDPALKKLALFVGIFLAIAGVLALVLNLIFRRPNDHNPARWGTVHVQLDRTFTQHQRELAQQALGELNRLGPTFVLDGSGSDSVRVINTEASPLMSDLGASLCADHGAARYVTDTLTGQSHIDMYLSCLNGDLEFRTALTHEIGHAMGMEHICRRVNEDSICSPVGHGIAVMNPSLADSVSGESEGDKVNVGSIPTWEIQVLDVQEFARVNHPGEPLIRGIAAPVEVRPLPTPQSIRSTRDREDTVDECNPENGI